VPSFILRLDQARGVTGVRFLFEKDSKQKRKRGRPKVIRLQPVRDGSKTGTDDIAHVRAFGSSRLGLTGTVWGNQTSLGSSVQMPTGYVWLVSEFRQLQFADARI
jgi:hypothetical protein